jgi:hypothetical protein
VTATVIGVDIPEKLAYMPVQKVVGPYKLLFLSHPDHIAGDARIPKQGTTIRRFYFALTHRA